MLTSRAISGSRFCFRARPFSSQSTKGELKEGAKQENEVEEQKPLYATKANYQKKVIEQRFHNAEEGSGQRPTKWQRRFLVWTKLYSKQSEIPDLVAHGTMDRMHDRLRVLFIVTACVGFFTIFFVTESWNSRRIQRDRDAGVVVTKM